MSTQTQHRPGRTLPSAWTEEHGVGCGHCGGWMTREVAGERWLCSGCPVGPGRRELPTVLDERMVRLKLRDGADVTSQPPALVVAEVGPRKGKVEVAPGPRPWPWLDPMTDRRRAAKARERQAEQAREAEVRRIIAGLTMNAGEGSDVLAEPCSEPGVQRRYVRRFRDGRPEQHVGDLLEGWVWRPGAGQPDPAPEPTRTVRVGGRAFGKTHRVTVDYDAIRASYERATESMFAAAGGFAAMNRRLEEELHREVFGGPLFTTKPPPPPGFERTREQVAHARNRAEGGRGSTYRAGERFEWMGAEYAERYSNPDELLRGGWTFDRVQQRWTRPLT